MHRYYLVYWPEERSVSTVKSNGICSPSLEELKVGVGCKVSIGRRLYDGKIAATGTYMHMSTALANYQELVGCGATLTGCFILRLLRLLSLGSKVEMERLEEDFVTGVWSPPFTDSVTLLATCNTAEPPSKRRRQQKTKTKTGKENNKQQTKTGKKNNKQQKSGGKENKQQNSGGKKSKQPGISLIIVVLGALIINMHSSILS